MNAALPKLEVPRPLRWSKYAITFDSTDQFRCSAAAGVLPMLCSPTISNVLVTKTLVDGGAGPDLGFLHMLTGVVATDVRFELEGPEPSFQATLATL